MNHELRTFLYLCSKFNVFMKKLAPFIGILLIITGALVLVATRFGSLGSHNMLLLTGLACIVTGIWLHIHSIKRDSRF